MFSVNFLANQYVSDEDINAIGYNLSNTVYTAFTNDTLYGVDALNEITAHMMNKGIKRNYKNECALSLADTNVHIDSGLAFFENGATIIIDDVGIDLTLEDSTETQYVYLFFNGTINVGGARCTVEYPSGDFVMLGSIKNGVLKQDRTFAYLNADAKGTNEVVTLVLDPELVVFSDGETAQRYIVDMNITGYAKAFGMTLFDQIRPVNPNTSLRQRASCIMIAYDIQNNKCLGYSTYYESSSSPSGVGDFKHGSEASYNGHPVAYIEDGRLVIDVWYNQYKTNYFSGKQLKVDLYGGAEE